ncbi:MAG TPA: phosphonate C-P lyase system protein PhnL [Clostridia bacterium]
MLNVINLSKTFLMHIRGGKKITSLYDVSFSVAKGEFLGITGPSGSGKSSLLKCIYRSYIPTSGNIFYDSELKGTVDMAIADEHTVLALRKSEIGYISQFLHVIPRVNAIDVITDALKSKGFSEDESLPMAGNYLSRVGIPESLWEMYPSTFSGGEKQRLNIVHAIASKPRLLLLDEPTASLDSGTKKEVVSLIKELKDEGTAMVGVFHDYETLMQLSDREYAIKSDSLCQLQV